ncbi:hypothetical protein [Sphingopyxis sp. JAI128]|uniref:hypothetical protein n=1 Tax=Sphingopyxis sp. JAI128 TaxID=2723066 RepID=UPI00161CE69D|nr:hypothetical protein [Sphingopyxis sp. JAI128]MBB6425815.1 hypothetical protein [Sphingopyxis sp. JAI128]
MRKVPALIALALVAAPALAQPAAGPAPPADTVDGKAADAANLTLATREQVRPGVQIHSTDGQSIGTVQGIDGDTAIVVRDGALYNIPLAAIYHGAVGSSHGLVTKLSRAEIEARTTAAAE